MTMAPVTTMGGTVITLRDTEMFGVGAKADTPNVLTFNPHNDSLPRMKATASTYQRFRIKYVNIAYVTASSAATDGSIAFGVAPGPALSVPKRGDILKLRPAQMVPVWKSATINLGNQIDSSRYMFVGDTTRDGVAFTLYHAHSCATADPGYFKVSYEIELAYPHP